MTPDLMYLTYTAILAFVQVVLFILAGVAAMGLTAAVGNREDVQGDLPGFAGRAARAHRNMLENLLPFAIFVIVAHLAGKANEMSALGAMIFFYARLAYAVIYLAGIPWLRTLAWAAGVVGMVLVVLQLFQ